MVFQALCHGLRTSQVSSGGELLGVYACISRQAPSRERGASVVQTSGQPETTMQLNVSRGIPFQAATDHGNSAAQLEKVESTSTGMPAVRGASGPVN